MTSFGDFALGVSASLDPVTSALGRVLFGTWPGAIFQTNTWNGFMRGFAIGLATTTAAFLIIEQRVRALAKLRAQPAGEANWLLSPRLWRRVGILLTVISVFCYFDFLNPNTRYSQYYHRHELYHYYLGSKYFRELGYSRLYECTLIAESELGRSIKDRSIRDLSHRNVIVPVAETAVVTDPAKCKRHFSEPRWNAFKADIDWFERNARGNYWTSMQQDHGYNPAPVWTMTGQFFGSFGVASDHFFKWLALIDVSLHIGIVYMLAWGFGWRTALVASVFWGTNTASNFYWTGGAFLRQDWTFLFIASMSLARKARYFLSGAALMWSSLLRVFPAASFAVVGFMIGKEWLAHRRLEASHKRFIAGSALTAACLVPISMWISRPDALSCAAWRGKAEVELTSWDRTLCFAEPYAEFAGHIKLHRDTPLTNHMGLESIVVHTWDGRMRFTQNPSYDDAFEPWKTGRLERKQRFLPLQLTIVGIVGAGVLWALHRRKALWLAIPFSVPLIIGLTNLTCYYYSLFLTFAPLQRFRIGIALAMLATSAASQVLLKQFYYIDDRYVALSYLYFALAVLVVYVMCPKWSLASVREAIARLSPRRNTHKLQTEPQAPT